MSMFGGDIGWAGAFTPMLVSAATLAELRNLAGPPAHPGMKMCEVNLETGQFKWKTAVRRSYSRPTRRRRK